MTGIIRIPDISRYKQEIINNELVLTPIIIEEEEEEEEEVITYITEDELYNTSLNHSKILKCIIQNKDDIISNKTRYRSICIDLWKTMLPTKILQNTTMNMKLTNENGKKGYVWNSELHISIQGKDANDTIIEIINMVKLNKYSIHISIKLKSDIIINFNNLINS